MERPDLNRLIDTNVLVYRYDPRDKLKRQIAHDLLRTGNPPSNLGESVRMKGVAGGLARKILREQPT